MSVPSSRCQYRRRDDGAPLQVRRPGAPVRRPSVPPGEGRYLDNLEIPGALHAVFVRSIMPHARIEAVDSRRPVVPPGVAAAYGADDLDLAPLPPSGTVEAELDEELEGELRGVFSRDPLARDVVRFVGELIAVVVADSVGQADDAAELVAVEYDELPMVVDVERAAAEDAPLLWPSHGTNVALAGLLTADDLEDADVVVRADA